MGGGDEGLPKEALMPKKDKRNKAGKKKRYTPLIKGAKTLLGKFTWATRRNLGYDESTE